MQGTVVEQQINVKMKPEDFQLEFPPGTLIGDGTAPAGPQQYVIRPDGTKRIVIQAELNRGATLEDLYSTPPGQAALPRGTNVWKYLMIGSITLLVVVLAARVGIRAIKERAGS